MTTSLEKSIAHWEENLAARVPSDVKWGPDHCALCTEFIELDCSGCPVNTASGGDGCGNTPYSRTIQALRDWKRHPGREQAYRDAALAELNFLKGLRK